ncbi:unnamed protein product [Gadus morhua 'NCC']
MPRVPLASLKGNNRLVKRGIALKMGVSGRSWGLRASCGSSKRGPLREVASLEPPFPSSLSPPPAQLRAIMNQAVAKKWLIRGRWE